MQPYLPTVHNLLGVTGLAAGLLMFLVLGAMTTARRTLPEIQLIAGWGLTCLALTAWGVLVPATLQIPLAVLGAVALLGLIHPRLRARIGPLTGAIRLLLLSLPLWLVMLPLRPSQIDTWLNLLPNAAYLFDHGALPTDPGPPSYSLLPGAPYNTQFVAYIASEASGSFADSAMALFNVALVCASGLLLARVVARQTPTLSWWACALGLLLTIPLNPGFVPRTFFASYGEAPLAVTTMFAVWLAVEVTSDLALGIAWPRATAALALVLAALVNIKQSGIGLLLSIGLALLALVLAHPGIPRRRGILVTVAALLPALRAGTDLAGVRAARPRRGRIEAAAIRRLEHPAAAAGRHQHGPRDLPEGHVLPVRGRGFGSGGLAVATPPLEPPWPTGRHGERCDHPVQRLSRRDLRCSFSGGYGGGRTLVLPLCVAALPHGHVGARRHATAARRTLAGPARNTCTSCRHRIRRADPGGAARYRRDAAL